MVCGVFARDICPLDMMIGWIAAFTLGPDCFGHQKVSGRLFKVPLQNRWGTDDEHEMKHFDLQFPRPHGDAPLVLRYEAGSILRSSKSVKFPLLLSNTRRGSTQTLHHFEKNQVLLQEVVVITADISYADFVPGIFWWDVFFLGGGMAHWAGSRYPSPGILANQSGSKSGGLRSAFGEGGLVASCYWC